MNRIDVQTKLMQFIQESSKDIADLADNKTLDEVADYLIEKGIFHSKKDIVLFLFDATPVMVLHEEIQLDLPVRYYGDDEEIEDPYVYQESISDFIEESKSKE